MKNEASAVINLFHSDVLCNKKFMNRFNYMEECASSEGHTLHELSLDRMEELWQQAKHAAAEKE